MNALENHIKSSLSAILRRQKDSLNADGEADILTRLDRIDRCAKFLVEQQDKIVEATQADWKHKPADFIRAVEVIPVINHAKHIRKNLKKWMKNKHCTPDFPFNLLGAKAYITPQPLGVIGIMVPWNGPLAMSMIASMDAFSAGNRTMIKVSELSPNMAQFMKTTLPQYFDDTEMAIITGELEVSRAFAELPFDHLMYTGSSATAVHVMSAAAKNLVPVTLELGGKSPVIISSSVSDLNYCAQRTMSGRLINSGQGCITPDYVLITETQLSEYLDHCQSAIRDMYPCENNAADFASIATVPHFERLQKLIVDTQSSGCDIITVDVGADQSLRQINPTIVINPPDHSPLIQEEIFGPILVVKTYLGIDQAIDYINQHDRPLALYYFGNDNREKQRVLKQTTSGGVSINEVMMHLMMSSLPFGGVGNSGTGSYWGGDSGFKRFSHLKSIYEQGWYTKLGKMMDPPYGDNIKTLLKMQLK